MIAALLLLAAFARVDLIDESVEIPASDWRYMPHPVSAEPGQLDCIFQADRPDARVRLVLLTQADLNLWREGHDHEETGATPVGPRGVLRLLVHDTGTFVAIENRGSQPVHVRLHVFLERPNVRYLSRNRQLAVILISFGVFFAIVTWSGRRLLRGIRR
ncbi:MAG TPA: hypothetical protein VKR61_18240 [Bryobacteraceae bacterium]|nr:hypothetical protein [Bryobacteraceae bacterium]